MEETLRQPSAHPRSRPAHRLFTGALARPQKAASPTSAPSTVCTINSMLFRLRKLSAGIFSRENPKEFYRFYRTRCFILMPSPTPLIGLWRRWNRLAGARVVDSEYR